MESGKGTSKWGSFLACTVYVVLLRWLSGKEPSCSAGNEGSIPGSGKSPGEGNGNPLQCSRLENPTDRNLMGYSPWGHKIVGHNLVTKQHVHRIYSFRLDTPGKLGLVVWIDKYLKPHAFRLKIVSQRFSL